MFNLLEVWGFEILFSYFFESKIIQIYIKRQAGFIYENSV